MVYFKSEAYEEINRKNVSVNVQQSTTGTLQNTIAFMNGKEMYIFF